VGSEEAAGAPAPATAGVKAFEKPLGMADRVSECYVEECLSTKSMLRTVIGDVDLPPALVQSAGQRLLPRPLFVDEAEMGDFADDVIRLFDLITSLPGRLFDADLDRYCAALRIDRRRAALMRRLGGGTPPLYGRADMYHDGTSFKLLEFNIASELGGVDRAGEIPRALLKVDAFASFANDHRLTYTHTGMRVARALRKSGETVSPDREPVVALLEAPGGMAQYGAYWQSFRELMLGLGLDFHVGEVSQVHSHGGKLYLGKVAIDVILRCFSVEEICEHPGGEALVEPIFRAHDEGNVVLWTPMESNLFGNKGCLALLCDPRSRTRFAHDELALIDRVLPWTRALGGGSTPIDDDVFEQCRERREELILKPNAGYGGNGILAGWETSDEDWRRALEDGTSAGWIVQRRVVPRLEAVVDPETRRLESWQAAWGLFVTPEGYAGAYARALPAGEGAVIGISANARTRTAGVFLCPP
jgi:hypothetical protein